MSNIGNSQNLACHQNLGGLWEALQTARTQPQSRVILTTPEDEPVAVLQEYGAYQQLLNLLETTQRALHVATTRERLRQINEGAVGVIPLSQVMARHAYRMPQSDD